MREIDEIGGKYGERKRSVGEVFFFVLMDSEAQSTNK